MLGPSGPGAGLSLSPLPLSTLPADPEVLRRLHLLGSRTLGALAALPRLALIRQFGSQAGFLQDLASGSDPQAVYAGAPPLVLDGAWAFEPPVADRGPLAAQVGRIVGVLAADLSRRGYQAEGMRVRLEDEEGLINVILKPQVYEASRNALRSAFVVVEGSLQRRGEAISALARRVVAVKPGTD